MADTPKHATPPASPHANWSTVPLVPRKSPERLNRRLALGHLGTQSLSLPRTANVQQQLRDAPEMNATLSHDGAGKASTDVVGQALLRLQLQTSNPVLATPTASGRGVFDQSPAIISPRPRRHTDLRALENTPRKTVEPVNPGTTNLEHSAPQPSRVGRLEQTESTALPMRRHIRGSRSMSPQRHERMSSSQPFSTFSRQVLPLREQSVTLQTNSEGPARMRMSEADRLPISQAPSNHLRTQPGGDNETQPGYTLPPAPLQASEQPDFVVPSEQHFEQDILRGRSFALSCAQPEIELDWARDVLRLTDRKQMRQQRLTDGASRALPLRMYDVQQEAIDVVQRLSHQRYGRAQFMMGVLLEFGKSGFNQDRRQAVSLYKDASKAGYPRADYRIGMQSERNGEMHIACESYERGASKDDAACLYRLGMMMLLGQHGYAPDQAKAINCIQLSALSADADSPQAAYVWALMLAGEASVQIAEALLRPDNDDAVTFLEKAAYLGFAPAQLRLGKAYELNELGCQFNPLQSVHYYMLAALGDEVEGDMALSRWYLAGSEDNSVQKDERKAYYHAELAARRGLASAEFALGYFSEVGVGCDADIQRAQIYYGRATEHGSEEAKARVDGIARSGTLSRNDHEVNVSTQVHARRATIKLNQKGAAKYRGKVPSMPTTQPPNEPAMEKLQITTSTDRRSSQLPERTAEDGQTYLQVKASSKSGPPSDRDVVEDLNISEKQRRSVSPIGTPPNIVPHDQSIQDSAPATQNGQGSFRGHSPTPPRPSRSPPHLPRQDHQRVQSLASQTSRWHLNDTVETSAMQSYSNGLRSAVPAAEPDRQGTSQSEVRSWTQRNADQPFHGSPNLAPSELGSLVEVPSMSSPRPESSISNIPPFRLPQVHTRHTSNAVSLTSHPTAPGSTTSSGMAPSSHTSFSGTSHRRTATTFEEMGIPVINKKKEECVLM